MENYTNRANSLVWVPDKIVIVDTLPLFHFIEDSPSLSGLGEFMGYTRLIETLHWTGGSLRDASSLDTLYEIQSEYEDETQGCMSEVFDEINDYDYFLTTIFLPYLGKNGLNFKDKGFSIEKWASKTQAFFCTTSGVEVAAHSRLGNKRMRYEDCFGYLP